jgi:hypothetical protein
VKEIPTYVCRTRSLQAELASYETHPVRRDGRALSYWEAHPEHWRWKALESIVCDQMVFRMTELCQHCLRRQWAAEQEVYRERRVKALAAKMVEAESDSRDRYRNRH